MKKRSQILENRLATNDWFAGSYLKGYSLLVILGRSRRRVSAVERINPHFYDRTWPHKLHSLNPGKHS
jgi:hypothetical protein